MKKLTMLLITIILTLTTLSLTNSNVNAESDITEYKNIAKAIKEKRLTYAVQSGSSNVFSSTIHKNFEKKFNRMLDSSIGKYKNYHAIDFSREPLKAMSYYHFNQKAKESSFGNVNFQITFYTHKTWNLAKVVGYVMKDLPTKINASIYVDGLGLKSDGNPYTKVNKQVTTSLKNALIGFYGKENGTAFYNEVMKQHKYHHTEIQKQKKKKGGGFTTVIRKSTVKGNKLTTLHDGQNYSVYFER